MRTLDRCILSAVAAGVLAAQPLAAQEPAPRTHTVVRGDNLWDLAQKYLGNAFLWPEIYRLNRDVIEDPHWIFPGEVLRLPGEGAPQVSQLPSGGIAPPPTQPVTPTPVQVAPVNPADVTVFTKIQQNVPAPVGDAAISTINAPVKPTVRAGEVLAAPYMDREGGPRAFGRILKTADVAGVAEASERYSFQAYDRVLIAPPVGQVAAEGERYLAYKLGPILEGLGQVVIPTGVIEITRAARTDTAAVAQVVRAYTELSSSDRLIPIDTAGVSTTVRPVRVVHGPTSQISWVYGRNDREPVLPSYQSFIVLNTSAIAGVKMGDEFIIYLPPGKPEEGQLADPDILIAKAQVVRSTPYGVTAVVLGQEQPAVKEGMAARLSARMP